VLMPETLEIMQTNQYDPNPLPRITAREWHISAKTTEKKPNAEFLLIVRPWKVAETETVPQTDVSWKREGDELVLEAIVNGRERIVRLGSEAVTVLP